MWSRLARPVDEPATIRTLERTMDGAGRQPAQASGDERLRLVTRILVVPPFPQMLVDGAARQPVQDHPAEKLGVGPLNLFRLRRNVPRQSDVQLYGTGLPHAPDSESRMLKS
jgi:hypothetical protein